jgi:hypothetical protein
MKKKYEDLIIELENSYKKKNEELDLKMKKNSEEFKQKYILELEKIQKEYYEAIKILENKNLSLSNEVKELQEYLIKRPSKDEDIEMINKLKDEIKMLEKRMADSDGLIEQFRNELLNREETYNGYFGRKPEVGYVNPLKNKNKMNTTQAMPLIRK